MPEPAVTVAMSVFNGAPFLSEAIESVLGQDFGDFEFLIVDDGSTDASPTIVRDYAAKDSRIRPILRENRGLVASLNEMIESARAPLIARMDSDDICRPDRFNRQVRFLNANPDYGVVGSWSEDIGVHGEPLVRTGADHPVTHEEMVSSIQSGGPLICHPAAMFRREIVRAVGGYHSAFVHCEDLDLWLRLSSVTRLGNIPERLLKYRRYPDQVSSRHAMEQQIGSVVAHAAWRERRAGRPDPTASLLHLPPIDELDTLFGQTGLAWTVREQAALGLLYSPAALRGEGFEFLLSYLKDGGRREGMWRTVLRLVRFGEPRRALRLAWLLLRSSGA
ncbi:glycosyltransferase [Novosphingobium panipatense]|uniref:Glycosyl transferase family 2 n=1 Tax=Novosphingobium panipatense TaxID=428991 RepID=A0ABY1QU70_9SPHN|nr:glycosyltransferase [Novosphingobium panipatense]SMP80577.1 Glycosyl transferase family 2 [Novosphingobium panipatense]